MENPKGKRMHVFIGSYAEAAEPGIYLFSFDEEKGELTQLDQASGLKNPTFLNVDAANSRLYSIAEGLSEQGERIGEAVVFDIDSNRGKLTPLHRSIGVDKPACHIQRDAGDRYLLLSSYQGGRVGLTALAADGRIGRLLDVKVHEGGSVHERQDQPHPHSAWFSPDGRFIFVPDLGIDRICTYTIDPDAGELRHHGDTKVHPGAGPRHMAFHPQGQLAYVINEIDSTITAFRYDVTEGLLYEIEHVSTLPVDWQGENTCAEITISEDGRFLYGSNRGHDSIVVYAIDSASGKLTYVEHVSTEGEHPRHFSILPGGEYLLAANRDTNNLALFRVDVRTGRLQYTGHSVQVSKPVCVKAAYF